MNPFFEKGIELAEQKFVETGDFKAAVAVLEHTCDLCHFNSSYCPRCVIDYKKDEFEHPRQVIQEACVETAASTDTVTIKRRKKTTIIEEEEIISYRIGDILASDGKSVFLKYRKGEK